MVKYRTTMAETLSKAKINLMTKQTYVAMLEKVRQAEEKVVATVRRIGEAAGSNSDYHDNAAFDQANIDHNVDSSILAGLRIKMRDVGFISPRQQTDNIGIGNTVVVRFEGEKEDETFTILGPDDDTTFKYECLSFLTPLGESLLCKKEGEIVEYSAKTETKSVRHKVKIIKILPGNFE